jgi:regulation of enolase protein 1 (concanavalin A-like superfamily)
VSKFDDSRRSFVKAAAAASAVGLVNVPNVGFAEEKPTVSLRPGESWMNPPKRWWRQGETVFCTAEPKTDFWRKTFYGYVTDNGHLLYRTMSGDFTTTVKVMGTYHDLYDQAGLMVRTDEANWMKCGVELVEDRQYLSVVFTRDFSDWSTARLPEGTGPVWMKVIRKGDSLDILYSLDGKGFTESRMGYFSPSRSVMVGPMCAAPEGNGFEARFEDWKIETKS